MKGDSKIPSVNNYKDIVANFKIPEIKKILKEAGGDWRYEFEF